MLRVGVILQEVLVPTRKFIAVFGLEVLPLRGVHQKIPANQKPHHISLLRESPIVRGSMGIGAIGIPESGMEAVDNGFQRRVFLH